MKQETHKLELASSASSATCCCRAKETSLSGPKSREETAPSQAQKFSHQVDEEVVSNALAAGEVANFGRAFHDEAADVGAERSSRDSQEKVKDRYCIVLLQGLGPYKAHLIPPVNQIGTFRPPVQCQGLESECKRPEPLSYRVHRCNSSGERRVLHHSAIWS